MTRERVLSTLKLLNEGRRVEHSSSSDTTAQRTQQWW